LRLALQLGRADVDLMLGEITSRQFAEWQAFFELEPFGSRWEDLRAGQAAAVVRNGVLAAAGAKAKPMTADDVMPVPDERERKAQTGSKLKAGLSARRKRK
jgi:hypothetical protein